MSNIKINFSGWRSPDDGKKKVVVPGGMLDAAIKASMEAGLGIGPSTELRVVIEAALRWQSENTPHPTDKEFGELIVSCSSSIGQERWEHSTEWMRAGILCHEWVRRMYYAPEPEVPEEIKRIWEASPTPETKRRIVEAFRIGQKSKAEPVRN